MFSRDTWFPSSLNFDALLVVLQVYSRFAIVQFAIVLVLFASPSSQLANVWRRCSIIPDAITWIPEVNSVPLTLAKRPGTFLHEDELEQALKKTTKQTNTNKKQQQQNQIVKLHLLSQTDGQECCYPSHIIKYEYFDLNMLLFFW